MSTEILEELLVTGVGSKKMMRNSMREYAESELNGFLWEVANQFCNVEFRKDGGVMAETSRGHVTQFYNLESFQKAVKDNYS